MSAAPRIRRLCVIGVGLIGGSLACALRKAEAVNEIVGCGRGQANLDRALELGVIDRAERDPAVAVSGADMVVLAVPLRAMESCLHALRPALATDAIITDVGSAKQVVVEQVERVFGAVPECFVPGHPIAGTEHSGVEAAFATLFCQRKVILTPLVQTRREAHDAVRAMWQHTGAEVVDMGVRHHDQVLAATSHLPHILAYTLVDCLAQLDDRVEMFRYAAGGFRDFTRIASSDPVMWRDICSGNRAALIEALDLFQTHLGGLRRAIESGDLETLQTTFSRAKQARDNLYLDGTNDLSEL